MKTAIFTSLLPCCAIFAGDALRYSTLPGTHDAIVNVRDKPFNAIGDGVVDDAPAIQAALNYAWGTNNTYTALNKTVYIPPGIYNLGSTLLVTNVRSAKLIGGGKYNTVLRAYSGGPCIQSDGFWFSHIEGINFTAGAGGNFGLLELDGNIDHSYTHFGVQGNSINDCYFEGSGTAANGLAIVPNGNNYGQGSENVIINCNFISFTNAAILVNGYNALQNTMIGGNIQNCFNDGIYVPAGQLNVFSTGFQNETAGYGSQKGYDVHYLNSAGEVNVIIGCRSESLKAVKAESAHIIIDGWQSFPAAIANVPWVAGGSYTLNATIVPPGASGYAFVCVGAGVAGGIEPSWIPYTTTISDGGVTWKRIDVAGVYAGTAMNLRGCNFPYVFIQGLNAKSEVSNCTFTRPDWMPDASLGSSVLYVNGAFGPLLLSPNSSPFSVPNIGYPYAKLITSQNQINFGTRPLVFSSGDWNANLTWNDVGFWRNDGTNQAGSTDVQDSHNVIGVIGSLGKPITTNETGDDLVLVGGIGSTNGGKIRLMTQRTGSPNATDGLTVDNAGVVWFGTNSFSIIGTNLIINGVTR